MTNATIRAGVSAAPLDPATVLSLSPREGGAGRGEEASLFSDQIPSPQPSFRLGGARELGAGSGWALVSALICAVVAVWIFPLSAGAQGADSINNEYRLTLFPYYSITTNTAGFGYLGYVNNPDKDFQTFYLGKGVNSFITPSVQLWGGLISTYTDNDNSANQLELRPFAGAKLFLPNELKWNIYNFTRYEYRALQDQETYDWNNYSRIRTRFGVEFPLVSLERAWQPKTWYALADVEPYFRFDKNTIDPLRVRGGIAYIVSDRVRVELIYHAQFTRPAGSTGLEYTDNIFRLNFKLALDKKVLGRVFNGGDADD